MVPEREAGKVVVLLSRGQSRWYPELRGDFHDKDSGFDYDVYFAFLPLEPLDPHGHLDPVLHGVRAWERLAIVDLSGPGILPERHAHVNTSSTFDELLRAQLECLGPDKGLFFVGGDLVKVNTEYFEGSLNIPPNIDAAIHIAIQEAAAKSS